MTTNLKRWTLPDSYFGDVWPDYYSAGFGQSRDSDALERSNFRVALAEIGGESETVIVVRESHWAVGWVEWVAVHESDSKSLEIASRLAGKVENYPILDEEDFSTLEQEDANEVWRNCYSPTERIEYIRKHRSQFEFHGYRDMIGCIRGRYFAGYASGLLY